MLNHPLVTALLYCVGAGLIVHQIWRPASAWAGRPRCCVHPVLLEPFPGRHAEWLEVMLFVAGVLLLLVEIFLIPGFGL